jgi:glucokinase
VLDTFSIPTDKSLSPEDMFLLLSKAINEFKNTHHYDEEISGVGLGIPGLLDKKKGIIFSSPNMPTWLDFEVSKFIEKHVGLPVKIVNDASAAALGEARYGSGKDYQNLIMITLGTGVGGGIVLDKKLYDGLGGTGAQLGHSLIELNGRPCGCGRRGCLEAYASATALIKETQKAIEKHPESLMNEIAKGYGKVSARVAFDAERKGDKVAHQLIEEYIMYLSEGLLDYCNIFRPDIFVLSGGVANEGDYLISRIEKYLKDHNYGFKGSPAIPVKQAILGYDSGKIGAASLFFYND